MPEGPRETEKATKARMNVLTQPEIYIPHPEGKDAYIDVGGGRSPAKGFTNLDSRHGRGKWKREVQEGIPVEPGSAEVIRAFHLIEHIPKLDHIDFFNEVWRALRTGGEFIVQVPVMREAPNGAYVANWKVLADPTHVSLWCKESFFYFTGQITAGADYKIKPWQMVFYCEINDIALVILKKLPLPE